MQSNMIKAVVEIILNNIGRLSNCSHNPFLLIFLVVPNAYFRLIFLCFVCSPFVGNLIKRISKLLYEHSFRLYLNFLFVNFTNVEWGRHWAQILFLWISLQNNFFTLIEINKSSEVHFNYNEDKANLITNCKKFCYQQSFGDYTSKKKYRFKANIFFRIDFSRCCHYVFLLFYTTFKALFDL